MQRISAIDPATANGRAKKLLDGVQAKLGMTPNMMKTMAAATATLEGYLNLSGSLATGTLDAKFREQIALAVAQANSCEYCLAAHSAIGQMVGLTAEEIRSSRAANAKDAKREKGLRFVQALLAERGNVSDQSIANIKAAGYSDGEIAEIIANVALNIFTNYFNSVARTEVDFPKVSLAIPENEIQPAAPIKPPFTLETALAKVQMAEDAWNSRDPERVALGYSLDSRWRNRTEFLHGREEIKAFLRRKWAKELDYRLKKTLWGFRENRIAVSFEYEWHDESGQWHRSYGNELWEFDSDGLMRERRASINDAEISESGRRL